MGVAGFDRSQLEESVVFLRRAGKECGEGRRPEGPGEKKRSLAFLSRMRLSGRKAAAAAAVLALAENIEMDLFSLEEAYLVSSTAPSEEEIEEFGSCQTHLEHPLVHVSTPDPEPDRSPIRHGSPATSPEAPPPEAPPPEAPPPTCRPRPSEAVQGIQLEMEVFPLPQSSEAPPTCVTPVSSPDAGRRRRWRWRRLEPARTGLAVRDVVCLPRGDYLAQLERHGVPRGRERGGRERGGPPPVARVSVDYGWTAAQVESRLAALFAGPAGQTFSFTYLQCLQGSRVLFVPEPPPDGWTGEQVLRISCHGVLYILSNHDDYQVEPERSPREKTLQKKKKQYRVKFSSQGRHDGPTRPGARIQRRAERLPPPPPPEVPLDTDAILKRFKKGRRSFFIAAPEEAEGREEPPSEVFRLKLLELQQSAVFEGRPGRLLLTCDLRALEERRYYQAGALIGRSLLHGGPGPRCLHPTLYQLMCGHNASLEDFSWRDVGDEEVQLRLQELRSCMDATLLSPGLRDWISSFGIPGVSTASSEDLPFIYSSLVKHYIYYRPAAMISQFSEGLNACGGLWDAVRSHWEAFAPVMTCARRPLTLDAFRRLFAVRYSQSGGPLRAAEETTIRRWEELLATIGDQRAGFSLEDLLAFITGSERPPPLGFPSTISLRFYSQDAIGSRPRLPHASAAALELFLPRGGDDLAALLDTAVHEALGSTCTSQLSGASC